jgi:UDP-GlcNAc3NAcA epimerase
MKIVTVVGARPQFIKSATVSRAITEHNKFVTNDSLHITEVIVHTGQHFDRNMSDIFFEEMRLPKISVFLNINSLSHGAMTGQMLDKLEQFFIKEKPDMVLVYGDTNSTLAAALAAAKLHIPIGHVEAGLRSFNRRMPEEVNRLLTDHLSELLFCPTEQAVNNLKLEGIGIEEKKLSVSIKSRKYSQRVELVGDVMYDAALFYQKYAKKPDIEIPDTYILATIHRAENTDDETRLRSIFKGFDKLSQEISIVIPLHPRTKKRMHQLNIDYDINGTKIIDPVGYLEMIYLLGRCVFVMTDSGGLQKEAFFFKKPCIILREETEWVELVEHEYNLLAGTEAEKICAAFAELKNNLYNYNTSLYGDGKAGEKIVDILISL